SSVVSSLLGGLGGRGPAVPGAGGGGGGATRGRGAGADPWVPGRGGGASGAGGTGAQDVGQAHAGAAQPVDEPVRRGGRGGVAAGAVEPVGEQVAALVVATQPLLDEVDQAHDVVEFVAQHRHRLGQVQVGQDGAITAPPPAPGAHRCPCDR